MRVAIQLLIVVVGHLGEFRLILRGQYRHTIPSEVGASHRNDMCAGVAHDRPQHFPQPVLPIGRDVVELINRQQGIVEL